MTSPTLLDQNGRPIKRADLTREIAAASVGGVRSPISGYPSDGLTPIRLAAILREADRGSPVRYLELAEIIEERDPHYLGVLGTRRRSVSQIEISVDAATEEAKDEEIAQMVRDRLKRGELTQELFDILDCLGKGYSFTEIIWKNPNGKWEPARLKRRDPRWFRFDPSDLETPLMLDDFGKEVPLVPGKFIYANIPAKSGIALRSGLARVAAWGWMFKAFTLRDWAIFTQTYGQPVRVGKFDANATDEDKRTLFQAVANIAGDCAAIIPRSMEIEFIEAGNVGASSDLYEKRADWFDKQISKAVLGQTATTDAVVGGLGSGKEHRAVQKDIETADATALAALLNEYLIRPWIELRYPGHGRYPSLKLQNPEEEDLAAFATAISPLIDRGLEVSQETILSRFRLPEPKPGAKMLRPQGAAAVGSEGPPPNSEIKRNPDVFKRVKPNSRPTDQLQAEGASVGDFSGVSPEAVLAGRMMVEAEAPMAAIMGKIEAMVESAKSFDELRAMLLEGFPDIDAADLAQVLSLGLLAAHGGGRAAVLDDSA